MRNIGLGALLAESINGLFFRNAVSFGYLALECPGVMPRSKRGRPPRCRSQDCIVRNRDTRAVLQATPVPERLLALMTGGGIFPLLEAEG